MSWRSLLALVVVSAAVAVAAGAAMTLLVGKSHGATTGGKFVRLGLPASLPSIDHEPFCVPLRHFCIAQAEPGHVVALYTYDPHAVFRERGCEVRFNPQAERENNAGKLFRGLFNDPCGGSVYDMTGHRLFGPAPRDLDRFPVQVTKDATIVDTRALICGERQLGDAAYGCQFAPADR